MTSSAPQFSYLKNGGNEAASQDCHGYRVRGDSEALGCAWPTERPQRMAVLLALILSKDPHCSASWCAHEQPYLQSGVIRLPELSVWPGGTGEGTTLTPQTGMVSS